MSTTTTTKRTVSAAISDSPDSVLHLVRLGWHVFPCHSAPGGRCSCGEYPCGTENKRAGKHPWTRHGLKEATTNERQIHAWANKYPGCNWAVATGPVSCFFVLDVDGEGGRASLAVLETQYGRLPETLSCRTGREDGGEQRYFTYSADRDIGISAGKLGHGLDIRGASGYAIVPPSVHRSGRAYEWLNPHAHIASAPGWLLEMVTALTSGTGRIPAHEIGILIDGQRNDGLFRYGCALRRKGAEHAEIKARLLAANQRRCRPPVEQAEVLKISGSAARYPVGGPDPLEQAWQATQEGARSSPYEQFLGLCRHLQLARPRLTIALPLKRIGELMGCDWTQVRRWRCRAVLEGSLSPKDRYVPHRRAAQYVYREFSGKAESPKLRTGGLTAVPGAYGQSTVQIHRYVPLTCTTSGLVGQSIETERVPSGTPVGNFPSGTPSENEAEVAEYVDVLV